MKTTTTDCWHSTVRENAWMSKSLRVLESNARLHSAFSHLQNKISLHTSPINMVNESEVKKKKIMAGVCLLKLKEVAGIHQMLHNGHV